VRFDAHRWHTQRVGGQQRGARAREWIDQARAFGVAQHAFHPLRRKTGRVAKPSMHRQLHVVDETARARHALLRGSRGGNLEEGLLLEHVRAAVQATSIRPA
jgi:hypothetical protein